MPKLVDLTNKKFGKLLVLERNGSSKTGEPMWLCQCDCGNTKTIRGNSMVHGKTTSCGCANKEIVKKMFTKHNLSTSIEYSVWHGMIQRCYDEKHNSYSHYGGRGITVCDRWYIPDNAEQAFLNFYEDMAPRPDKRHTLERLDVNKGYSKDNCIWTTYDRQRLNSRKHKNTSTKFKGVYFNKGLSKPYYAQINHKYIGSFKTAEEAAIAYDTEFEKIYPEAAKYGTNKGLGLLTLTGYRRLVFKPEYQHILKSLQAG